MKKALSLFVSLCIAACCFSGCQAENSADAGSYTFTDDLGRTVTVDSCRRVAALMGSYADIWQLAGGNLCAAADDAWEDLDLALSPDTVNLGETHTISKDVLLAADPDYVLASAKLSGHLELEQTLESCGIAVAYFDVPDFDSYLHMLRICTDLTGQPERYEQYGQAQETQIGEILARNADKEPQTVLVLRASAASIRVKNSSGTMLGGMLQDFGCVNIADQDDSLLENLNIEHILLENPDKIFFVQTGDDMASVKENVQAMFDENPLWQQLDAVKNGQVYFMDKRLYNLKPNARFAEAYENLENILYGQ